MKICYIYREKEKNEHSIEAVFDTVSDGMVNRGISIYKWYKPVSWKKTFKEIWELRRMDFDIYHITGDVNYLWLFFPWKKTLMTVHDIGMYKNNPRTLMRRIFVFVSFVMASWMLKKITCVSNLTKNDLVKILHINPNKLSVISNPLCLAVTKKEKLFNKECPTILQIGTGWHKNLIGLIESVKGLRCRLDIIGHPDEGLIEKMNNYGIEYEISCHLTGEQVAKKYYNCDILYFVSNSEGFGLPILEAQTVGRPVITSCEQPMCDVAGDGAMLCSPNDYKAIRNSIIMLCEDETFRLNLVKNGFINLNRFSLDSVCEKYIDIYSLYN